MGADWHPQVTPTPLGPAADASSGGGASPGAAGSPPAGESPEVGTSSDGTSARGEAPPGSGSPPTPARRSRLRLTLSILAPVAVVGVMAYLLAKHGSQIEAAAKKTSLAQLATVTALALLTLVARTEAVVASLTAMGSRPRRSDIHAANSLTFVAALINHYISSIVRAGLLRRLDRDRSPTVTQMFMVDTSTTLIEALVVAVLIVVSAGELNLAWWVPVLLIVAGVGALAAALAARRRFSHYQLFRGLDVLAHSRQRAIVGALMVLVIVTQVVRTLIVLTSVGLHPSLVQAVATFVAAGVLSQLFAGPGAGTAGGPLIVFGHRSLAASAAAGLELWITTLIAGMLYAAIGGPLFAWRLRPSKQT